MIFVWALVAAAVVSDVYVSGARIVGGTPTTVLDYPAIVQVEFRSGPTWSQSCAASILTSTFLVSTAHCFAGDFFAIQNRRLRAGATGRNVGGTVIGIASRTNHPSYRHNQNDFDVAIIRPEHSLQLGPTISTVPIVPQGFDLPDGLPVTLVGWGSNYFGGPMSSVLHVVEVFSINHDICNTRYQTHPQRPHNVTSNMICDGVLDVGGSNACQGDFGGPVYYGGALIGIKSWGEGCANSYYPGVSTKVSSFTDWFIQNFD